MVDKKREQLWRERIAEWQASGMSQQAYATEQGVPVHQVGYWVRRLTKSQALPALLPVKVVPTMLPTPEAISLRNERGWTLTLPGDVPASWLAEVMRAL